MNYILKTADGKELMGSREQIIEAVDSGTLGSESKVRPIDSEQWLNLKEFLTSVNYVAPSARCSTTQSVSAGTKVSFSSRYNDAYTQAHVVVTTGKAIKVVGVILFIVIVLIGLIAASNASDERHGGLISGGQIFFATLMFACLIGIPIYILGILLASQGQMQLATLDTAVNSSRHLTDDQVADILNKRFSL